MAAEAGVAKAVVRTADGVCCGSLEVALTDSIGRVQERIADSLRLGSEAIPLSYNGECLSVEALVSELGVGPGGELELTANHPPLPPRDTLGKAKAQNKGKSPQGVADKPVADPSPLVEGGSSLSQYTMPSAFTVQIQSGGSTREVLVVVEKATATKSFLGGYRHRTSGVEYHHCACQTAPQRRVSPTGVQRTERETQTVVSRNTQQQTLAEAATQMTSTGCYASNLSDQVLYAGPYQTADEYHARRWQAVVVLQSHVRRWLAERYVAGLRNDRAELCQWEAEQEAQRRREREERIRHEFERRLNPRSKEDFEVLYHALEMWRQDEMKRINASTSGAERKAALCGLLEQEAQLIASIGRHRIAANQENRVEETRRLLDAMAGPKRWIAFDGRPTEVDTPYSIRAKQLKDLYLTLSVGEGQLGPEERLDALLSLKTTVGEHDCRLTREITELVDREAELMQRGMKEASLKGLRKRISTLFLQYIKTPLFNPAAASHIKIPTDPSLLRAQVYYCRSCSSYLPSTEFELSSNSRSVGHCRSCRALDNKARDREDHSTYRAMLREIRTSEERFADGSKVVFLMQEADMKHLVEGVWGGQSVLSAERDLFELAVVRWDRSVEWSPWNCVVLTHSEADYHRQLDNVEEAYGPSFVHKVQQRHVLAKNYFARLPHFSDQMQSKVREIPFLKGPERVVALPTRQKEGEEARQEVAAET